MDNALKLIDRF